jgi:hypothetical protein
MAMLTAASWLTDQSPAEEIHGVTISNASGQCGLEARIARSRGRQAGWKQAARSQAPERGVPIECGAPGSTISLAALVLLKASLSSVTEA